DQFDELVRGLHRLLIAAAAEAELVVRLPQIAEAMKAINHKEPRRQRRRRVVLAAFEFLGQPIKHARLVAGVHHPQVARELRRQPREPAGFRIVTRRTVENADRWKFVTLVRRLLKEERYARRRENSA